MSTPERPGTPRAAAPVDDGHRTDARDEALDRLYRALPDADAQPDRALDARILDAANRATAPSRAQVAAPAPPRRTLGARAPRSREMPWWRKLLVPISLAATALISVGLVVTGIHRGGHEPPVVLAESSSGPDQSRRERSAIAPPPPAQAPSAPAPMARNEQRAAAAAGASAADALDARPAKSSAAEGESAERRAAGSALGRERRDSAERFDPAWQAPTAAERLIAIEALLDRGDREGARGALKALRARFPDAAIPERLRPLL